MFFYEDPLDLVLNFELSVCAGEQFMYIVCLAFPCFNLFRQHNINTQWGPKVGNAFPIQVTLNLCLLHNNISRYILGESMY